jgi:Flp pilus assembly secretin CpaC
MDVIAADSPPFHLPARPARPPHAATTRIASNETQVLLRTRVIELDEEKLAEAEIDLLELTKGKDVVAPPRVDADNQVEVSLVSEREAALIAKLLTTSKAGKTLAEPTIVATYGRPARFHSGGEFPILISQGPSTQSVEYRQFGTSIKFLPTQMPGNKVRLEMRIEHAELDHSKSVTTKNTTVPGLKTRWLDMGIELESGRTAIIRGDSGERILVMVTPEIVEPQVAVAKDTPVPQRLPAISEILPNGQPDILLLAGNSMVLAFPHKIPKLVVSPEGIIKAHPAAPDKVRIHAEQAGKTTLTVWNEDSEIQEIPITVAGRRIPDQDAQAAQPLLPPILPSPPLPALKEPTAVTLQALLYRIDAQQLDAQGFDLLQTLETAQTNVELDDLDLKQFAEGTVSVITPLTLASLMQRLSTAKGVQVMSRPQVRTLSGQPARVEVGQEVRLPSKGEVQPASDEIRNVGVSIDLIPIVLGDGRIRLEARAVQSRIGADGEPEQARTWDGVGKLHVGETLAVYQDGADNEQLLMFVTLQSAVVPNTTSPATPPSQELTQAQPDNKSIAPWNTTEDTIVIEEKLRELRRNFGKQHPMVVQLQTQFDQLSQQEARQRKREEAQRDRKEHEFEEVTREMFPDAKIKLRTLASGVILSGTLVDRREADLLIQIAQEYFPSVIDNLHTAGSPPTRQANTGEQLQTVLRELFPEADIKVKPLNSSVVLSGTVEEGAAQQITRVAEDYYPQVIDHLRTRNTHQLAVSDVASDGDAASAIKPHSLDEEIRQLRDDVKSLRHDVGRLLEILEQGEQKLESSESPEKE